ncbi:hypothetical protein MMC13_000433 [Lambiella insularis]|nr:hypothetical protein [Lambiella insularis]
MAESPPKRVTRARAKAGEGPGPNSKTTKITTASARIVAESKTPAKAATKSKRKPRATDLKTQTTSTFTEVQDTETMDLTRLEPMEVTKVLGRPKKMTKEIDADVVTPQLLPRTRSRLEKAKRAAGSVTVTSKPARERSKKQEELPADKIEAAETDLVVRDPAKKPTRTRATAKKPQMVTQPAAKASTLKKKVTFQDDAHEDKENVAIPSGNARIVRARPVGLRAKPVRKAASAKTNGQKKTRANQEAPTEEIAGIGEVTRALSPKKVTQVAKSSSISSDDELSGDKTPSKTLCSSPVRAAMSASKNRTEDSPDKGLPIIAKSPVKLTASAILSSPARRPPPPAFKNSLQESPRRVNLGKVVSIVGVPALAPSQITQSSSLLRSPARRPVSPLKENGSVSIVRTCKSVSGTDVVQDLETSNHSFKLTAFTPSKLCSSPLRRAKPRETPFKVHHTTLTKEEAHACTPKSDYEHKTNEQPLDKSEALIHLTAASESSSSTSIKGPLSPAHDREPAQSQEPTHATPRSKCSHTQPVSQANNTLTEPVFVASNPSGLTPNAFRDTTEDSDSEDELQSTRGMIRVIDSDRASLSIESPGQAQHLNQQHSLGRSRRGSRAPTTASDASMTPLALQLSSWLASSPDKKETRTDPNRTHNILGTPRLKFPEKKPRDQPQSQMSSPLKSTLFEDEMLVRAQEVASRNVEQDTVVQNTIPVSEVDQLSDESEEFGDENAVALDPQLLEMQHALHPRVETCTPAKVFQRYPREIHTVSKVPLRPAGQDSPLKAVRKRSRSLSSHSTVVHAGSRPTILRGNTVISYTPTEDDGMDWQVNDSAASAQYSSSLTAPMQEGQPAIFNGWSTFCTPTRTLRFGADAQIMRGAVVFVDVHTTEGADASGIFVELLAQMGAKCVKKWAWNPRASCNTTEESANLSLSGSPSESASSKKVGITHVVFKDGGKRTLEKVRESCGLVLCVGVSWVLDCERENRWLDESEYAIDTSLIPRGGQRRRKSMEPRMLLNMNGNLVPSETPARVSFDISPTKEFLNLSSPMSAHESVATPTQVPATPKEANYEYDAGASSFGSPTTPYYLSKGAELIQQTCPPKQTMQPLFPLSGRIEDQPDEKVRQRLLLARRKSLQWAPKVGSPLGRAVSYGK